MPRVLALDPLVPLLSCLTFLGAAAHGQCDSSGSGGGFPGSGSDSPLVFDLSGDGFAFTSPLSQPVEFDLNGDGQNEQTAWTLGDSDDAFLWLDLNGNDEVDSGAELFGNWTFLIDTGRHAEHGFAALQQYDDPTLGGNGDGVLSRKDAIFHRLRLWLDQDHDGLMDKHEAFTLASSDVREISLDYESVFETSGDLNEIRYRGFASPNNPTRQPLTIVDVFFFWREIELP